MNMPLFYVLSFLLSALLICGCQDQRADTATQPVPTESPPEVPSAYQAPPRRVSLCGCEPLSLVYEAQRSATTVFLGKVVGRRIVTMPTIAEGYQEYFVDFEVLRYWKSGNPRVKPSNRITVRTPLLPEHCGLELKPRESYLIYAVGHQFPFVSDCSRSIIEAGARDDIRELNKLEEYRRQRRTLD